MGELTHKFPETDIQFMSYADEFPIDYNFSMMCYANPQYIPEFCGKMAFAVNQFTNEQKSVAFSLITLKDDPLGNRGPEWLSSARTLLGELSNKTGVRLTLV